MSIYTILNYISVILLFACVVVISTQTPGKMQKLALLVCTFLGICCIGLLFKAEARDLNSYLLGQKIAYAFLFHAVFLLILFTLEYCRFSIPMWIQWIFHILNTCISVIALTMDCHRLLYKSLSVTVGDEGIIISKEYGPAHDFVIGLLLLYIAGFIAIAVIFTIKNVQHRKNYTWRLLIAVIVPSAAYFVPKLLGIESHFHSASLAFLGIMLVYMIYKNKLYDINNIVTEFSVASLEEGYVVFDDQYHFKGCNKRAEELFPILKHIDLDSDIREKSQIFVDYLDGKANEYSKDNLIFAISVRSIEDENVVRGKVIKIVDVTLERRYTHLLQENKERVDRDLTLAKNIQLSALPSVDAVFSGVSEINTAAYMMTAYEVGGDFYDFYMVDEKHAIFLIADVSGKGIPAAMFMMRAKDVIKNLTAKGISISEAFNEANKILCEGNDENVFLTAWMGILDLTTGKMSYVNAGHNPPIIIRADGKAEWISCHANFILAAMSKIKYTEEKISLNPGDRIFLYTDGVTEAVDPDTNFYGEDRLMSFMTLNQSFSVDDILPKLKEDIDAFVKDEQQFDDITMLMIEYKGAMQSD